MAFFEDILNGLTQPAARPSFGSMAVKAPTSTTGVAPSMAQPKLAQDSSGWDDMATFFAGMGEGGGALLPALGAGARAVSGEKDRRQRVNDTYDFLLRNGVAPEDAKATMASPDLLKMKLGQIFAPKTMTVNPGQKIIDAQGNVILDNSETMKPTPEQSNFMYGQENPEFLGFLDQQRARTGKPTLDEQAAGRAAQLQKLNIPPDSAEGKVFIATGKLPAAAYQALALEQTRKKTAGKITEGLKNLSQMTVDYDDASFANAVGPFQGAVPDSLAGKIPINIARGIGEIANWWDGGAASPSEVRSNIQGSTEALAAAIKPLIRGPGEGVWTDADQQRLVSVVGDLAQASTKEEFKRRLGAVRDRISANFGLDVDFNADVTGAGTSDAPVQVQTFEEALKLPKGTRFMTPDGREKVR